ncbi:CinA family protein [Candidatus Acetothermia bacterium]|nr:CinA family protein [Candidatus Acetothermia bacterium]MCI2427049.1 CinA family protein [Candidatus Acetothermia bacterium]MCI2428177.1 CinA family protein [Candidatus Acetothermia bacterium]
MIERVRLNLSENRMPEEILAELLSGKGWRIAVAESCTGGLLSHRITNIPGSSRYFLGGVITYANMTKEQLLGVPHLLLENYGSVSEETAIAMATGCKKLFASEIAIAITGIAGPAGGSKLKPIGSCYIALASQQDVICRSFCWQGDRLRIKQNSVDAAFQMVIEYLSANLRECKQEDKENATSPHYS